ncbi:hypothetical protein EDC96DRAFT_524891 [Choanephora cucurbitarum]|nr:hypothetical protein EDC96DRAFT_524891 [Choanephora cucurbitarum]
MYLAEERCLCLKLLQIFARKVENTSFNTEQTYIESVLLPFFDLYFDTISCTERFSCRGRLEPLSAQSALLEPLSETTASTTATKTTGSKRKNASASTSWLALQPDYLLKLLCGTYRFDVFCAEFKKPNANITQLVSDEAKLANFLKIMLDRLVLFGVPSPIVCGLIEDGTYLKTFKMMIGDDGKYDFVQLSHSKSVACIDDLLRLPILMQYFEQLRTIILDMQKKISLKMLGEDVPPCLSLVPSSWLRPSLEYPVADSNTKKQRTV